MNAISPPRAQAGSARMSAKREVQARPQVEHLQRRPAILRGSVDRVATIRSAHDRLTTFPHSWPVNARLARAVARQTIRPTTSGEAERVSQHKRQRRLRASGKECQGSGGRSNGRTMWPLVGGRRRAARPATANKTIDIPTPPKPRRTEPYCTHIEPREADNAQAGRSRLCRLDLTPDPKSRTRARGIRGGWAGLVLDLAPPTCVRGRAASQPTREERTSKMMRVKGERQERAEEKDGPVTGPGGERREGGETRVGNRSKGRGAWRRFDARGAAIGAAPAASRRCRWYLAASGLNGSQTPLRKASYPG